MRSTRRGRFVVKAFADSSMFALEHPTTKKGARGGRLVIENSDELNDLINALTHMQRKLTKRPQRDERKEK